MQRIGQNGGLCHGEQKANSYNNRKNSLKMFLLLLLLLLLVITGMKAWQFFVYMTAAEQKIVLTTVNQLVSMKWLHPLARQSQRNDWV